MKTLHLTKNKLLIPLLVLLIFVENSKTQSFAGEGAGKNNEFSFAESSSLKDNELDEMRGGFIARNGMVVDFSFSANTFVDGALINQIALNSTGLLSGVDSLQNIIQIGDGNAAFSGKIDVATLPDILTVVQNNISDLTIQQVNLFDITVDNINGFVQQAVRPELDFQSTIRLMP